MNKDWSKALRAIGVLAQAPANYQQNKRLREQQGIVDENRMLQNMSLKQSMADEADVRAKIEALTHPASGDAKSAPSFLLKQPRRQIAEQLLAKTSTPMYAQSLLKKQKPEDPAYTFTIESGPHKGKVIEGLSGNQWRQFDMEYNRPDKERYPVIIGGKTFWTTKQTEHFDYLTQRGRWSPPKDNSRSLVNNALIVAQLRANEMDKSLKDLGPKEQARMIKQAGTELDSENWGKASGGDPMIFTLEKKLWPDKTYYIWGNDIEDVKDFQDRVKRGEETQEDFEAFLEDVGY